jgi:hypothetical protein
VREEGGLPALFAGVRPRVLWISLGGAIFIGSFEELRRRLAPHLASTAGGRTGGPADQQIQQR